MFHWDSTSLGTTSQLIWNNWCTLIEAQIIAYTVVIHGCLDTRVETRCPGGVSISYLASRSCHFSYSEIVFSFQLLVTFSINHAKESLTVHLYIYLLFQIITSLWCRSALDNLSEFELVTMVITDYMNEVMVSNRRIGIVFRGMEWELHFYKKDKW